MANIVHHDFRFFERCRYYVTGIAQDRMLAMWVTSIMVVVHAGLGVAIVVGGRARFSLPSYEPLLSLVGGHVEVWGVLILISSALMTTPFRWPNIVGLLLGVAWMNMWMALFVVALGNYPTAAATPVVAYGGFAMIDAALLTARVLDKKRE